MPTNLPFPKISLPETKKFLTKPRNPQCKIIDATRLSVDTIVGMTNITSKEQTPELLAKIGLDGSFSLVMKYQREKDEKYYPACVLSMDFDDEENIHINQLQGAKNKVSFRVFSSLKVAEYFLKIIEESFCKKGIHVGLANIPVGLEHATTRGGNALGVYETLRIGISALNNKYGLE